MTTPTPRQSDDTPIERRLILRLGALAALAAALPGCATPRRRDTAAISPHWPGLDRTRPTSTAPSLASRPSPSALRPVRPTPTPAPPTPSMTVFPRSAWATADPIPSRMVRLGAVTRITVHHDGMPPVSITSSRDVAARLDLIRHVHQSKGWGDIGYHFIVDPFGQLWEGRPLRYQGAHVRNHNPHNLGVLALGNFEIQRPTRPQLATLERFLADRMTASRVPLARLRTHRELAPTLCPGRNMQAAMNIMRAASPTLARA